MQVGINGVTFTLDEWEIVQKGIGLALDYLDELPCDFEDCIVSPADVVAYHHGLSLFNGHQYFPDEWGDADRLAAIADNSSTESN